MPRYDVLTEPVNVASRGVTHHETPDVLVGSVYEYDHYGGNHPDCVDYAEQDDFHCYLDVTFPPEPVNVVTDGMTYQEKIYILSGSVYNYDDYCDSCTDYFDNDEPNYFDEQGDFDDVYGFVALVEYGMSCGLHGTGWLWWRGQLVPDWIR